MSDERTPDDVDEFSDELPEDIAIQIDQLADMGDEALAEGDWRGAIGAWEQALGLLPEPVDSWAAAQWLHGSIADAQWTGKQYAEAEAAARRALAAGGEDNGFLWLRLGQAQFERDRIDSAARSLSSAFALEGDEIFADEDPKYLRLARRGAGGV